MADAVTTEYIYSGHKRKTIHLTNISDGTGESDVVKVDVSALTYNIGQSVTHMKVNAIDYNIQGFTYVALEFDATTDDEIAVLPAGSGRLDWYAFGGKTDPQTTGSTGDILLTTGGPTSGATYDITIEMEAKS